MRHRFVFAAALCLGLVTAASGAVVYTNPTPNNLLAMAARPESGGALEIESADDFLLSSASSDLAFSLDGVAVPEPSGWTLMVAGLALACIGRMRYKRR